MKLVHFPDPGLKTVCDPLVDKEKHGIELLRDQFFSILDEYNGAGLAANQVGYTKRFFVMRSLGRDLIVVNPQVIDSEGVYNRKVEGCLSFPGARFNPKRWERVRITFEDATSDDTYDYWFSGFEAQVVQHEIDHLNGVTCMARAKMGVDWPRFPKSKK